MTDAGTRWPTYFISHGGGPWPWLGDRSPIDMSLLRESLQAMPVELGRDPRAVLVVSGHWERPAFTVQTSPHPPMVYDYGGFPDFTYRITYPAPGSPEVAHRVVELLDGAGIATAEDPERGFDHGVFSPMYVVYPDARVPLVQLSIRHGYDPAAHLAAGRALAPLRDEGVLVVGSGLSYHNLGRMGPAARQPSIEFDDWLTRVLTEEPPQERTRHLEAWEQAPSARVAHPSEDHLVPLMVAVGAAEGEPGTRTYHEVNPAFAASSSFRFGALPTAAEG